MTTTTAYDRIITALHDAGRKVIEKHGDIAQAQCPVS